MKVVVSDRADADLLQIYRYLVEQSPAGAESVAREIDRKFRNLGDFRVLHGHRDIDAEFQR